VGSPKAPSLTNNTSWDSSCSCSAVAISSHALGTHQPASVRWV
jgi:hypothetical protein